MNLADKIYHDLKELLRKYDATIETDYDNVLVWAYDEQGEMVQFSFKCLDGKKD